MATAEDDDEIPDDHEDDEFLRAVAKVPELEPVPASKREALAQLAQFRILEKIGRGGMGIVYRAEDEKLRRVVALKVLPDDFAGDEQRRKRFFREARVAGSLSHPNVATVYDVGEADGRIYIAMELVEGTTLRHKLDEQRATLRDALRITQDIARGVSKAHERGIAHRDLKPDNVMVGEDGAVKVLDFGLAKPVEIGERDDDSVTWTQEGRIVGTPGYMSPEQATGRAVDVRTDVFSIGVILYEMLAGERPFKGVTSMDVVIATSRDEPAAPSEIDPRVPRALDAIVMRCLEKEPAARYETATALLRALEDVHDTPAAKDRRALESRRQKVLGFLPVPTRALGAALLMALALGAMGWMFLQPSKPTRITTETVPPAEPPPLVTNAPVSAVTSTGVTTASTSATTTATITTSLTPVVAKATKPRASASATLPTEPPKAALPAESAAARRGGVIEQSPY